MPQDETVSEQEVEAGAQAIYELRWGEIPWVAASIGVKFNCRNEARAALTAAAQVRERAGERANWTVRVNPNGSVTSLEPDSGPDVLGERKGEE